MADADQILATIEQYAARLGAGDREGWVSLFTDDARQEDPLGSPVNEGHEAIGGFFDVTSSLLGPPQMTVHDGYPIVIGNEAVVGFQVVAGSGAERIRIPLIVDHMTFADDGRISELRAFWDPASMIPDPQ